MVMVGLVRLLNWLWKYLMQFGFITCSNGFIWGDLNPETPLNTPMGGSSEDRIERAGGLYGQDLGPIIDSWTGIVVGQFNDFGLDSLSDY